jgi:serine/threonine-protein kinase
VTQAARGLDDHVGPYRLIRAIGAGGSARIDLARIDRAYGFVRHVVIKRPLEHLRADPNVAASLRLEARIGGRLRHPNLVAVLDAGTVDATDGAYDYLALEYVHGTSLRDLMHTDVAGQVRAVPLAVALGIVIDIARGLHDAHELTDEHGRPLGLVHRDVSPGNVLLGLDGAVKVADFGIAKETRVSTLSGSMHGTVTYMAPELCRGHAFDRRADLWALGVILHELITRQRLFWADNDVASLHRVLSGQITRPRKLDPSVPAALDELVMTALAQAAGDRFATARELADALEAQAAAQGLVVGARWLARTVEDAAGARAAPWIASTTVVDITPTPGPASDGSLVDVLERDVEIEGEPLLPTFGPADERTGEEGALPAIAARPRRRGLFVAAGAIVGIGLGTALALHGGGAAPRTPAPALVPAVPMIATPPPAEPEPPPAPSIAPDQDFAIEASGSGAPRPVTRPHRHHLTNRAGSGSNAGSGLVPVPAESPAAVGSAAPPTHVEWKPTMLLPTDTGSGTTKRP